MEPKILPKILLLSMHKSNFVGLNIPSVDDEDTLRRENAKKIRDQFVKQNQEKGNELYLEWLERNQDTVDLVNKKLSLNLQSNDRAFKYSNDTSRNKLRENLNLRRYTTNGSLQPPSIRPAINKRKGSHAPGDDIPRNTSQSDIGGGSSMYLPQIGGNQYDL